MELVETKASQWDVDAIKSQLKEQICTVTFTKVDGTTRVMHCTLNSSMIPADLSDEAQKRTKTENTSVQAVYDVDAQGWRSFRWNSVVDFRSESNL